MLTGSFRTVLAGNWRVPLSDYTCTDRGGDLTLPIAFQLQPTALYGLYQLAAGMNRACSEVLR